MRKIISSNRRIFDDQLKQMLVSSPVLPSPKPSAPRQSPPIPQQKIVSGKRRSFINHAPVSETVECSFSTRDDTILITGGIGDFLAIESCFPTDLRQKLTTVVYATNKRTAIEALLRAAPNYPNLKYHRIAWDDFGSFWCFINKEQCLKHIKSHGVRIIPELEQAMDFSIQKRFNGMGGPYNYSSFIRHKIADISRFNLPDRFLCLAPFSTDKRIVSRDFSNRDWDTAINYLNKENGQGVILNSGDDIVPVSPRLINLSNQTTIAEAVEILKASSGYVGVDSWLSVLAPKIFEPNNMVIKSNNPHCMGHLLDYFAPQQTFSFVRTEIKLDVFTFGTSKVT